MQEKTIKVIPGLLFLFCLLGVFELALIIEDMNQTEKLEAEIRNNLKTLEDIVIREARNQNIQCSKKQN